VCNLKLILKGDYILHRKVSSPYITMEGKCTFSHESSHKIHYVEEGSYWLNQKHHEFYQERYFEFDALFLKILTKEKTILHSIELTDLDLPNYKFSNVHQCKLDHYQLDFQTHENKIITLYTVQGPSKNYTIESHLERAHG
jgi:hypothetical protein